jgi:hypothetical protein
MAMSILTANSIRAREQASTAIRKANFDVENAEYVEFISKHLPSQTTAYRKQFNNCVKEELDFQAKRLAYREAKALREATK